MYASHRFAKFAASALVAGGLGLAAVATAGTAGAISSTDDTFLAEITAEGITFDSQARGHLRRARRVLRP